MNSESRFLSNTDTPMLQKMQEVSYERWRAAHERWVAAKDELSALDRERQAAADVLSMIDHELMLRDADLTPGGGYGKD